MIKKPFSTVKFRQRNDSLDPQTAVRLIVKIYIYRLFKGLIDKNKNNVKQIYICTLDGGYRKREKNCLLMHF